MKRQVFKNSFRFRRMWRKTLERIANEPIEETPTMLRLKQFDPEEYERVKARKKANDGA